MDNKLYKKMNKAFDKAIKELIKANQQLRMTSLAIGTKDKISKLEYIRNFCIVKADAGRGIGKTRFIREHANSHSLVITPLRCRQAYSDNSWIVVSSRASFDNFKLFLRGRSSLNYIYVDEPSLIFHDWKIDLYDFLNCLAQSSVDFKKATVVMLGN